MTDLLTSNLVSRLRQRLITVPKPGTQPFDMSAAGYFQMGSVGGTHKPGDSAGVLSVFNTWGGGGNKLQEHIFAVDPLCEEAAQALERTSVETAAPLDGAIEALRDIAAMGRKAGSETAKHWLLSHGYALEEGGYVPGKGFAS